MQIMDTYLFLPQCKVQYILIIGDNGLSGSRMKIHLNMLQNLECIINIMKCLESIAGHLLSSGTNALANGQEMIQVSVIVVVDWWSIF